jgi:hypothetical protein
LKNGKPLCWLLEVCFSVGLAYEDAIILGANPFFVFLSGHTYFYSQFALIPKAQTRNKAMRWLTRQPLLLVVAL